MLSPESWISIVGDVQPALKSATAESFAFFGAVVVGALGRRRATKDVDILVKDARLTHRYLSKRRTLPDHMKKMDARNPDAIVYVIKTGNENGYIELWDNNLYGKPADGGLWAHRKIHPIEDIDIPCVCTEDLIASKVGRMRAVDIDDINYLVIRYLDELDYPYLATRCSTWRRKGRPLLWYLQHDFSHYIKRTNEPKALNKFLKNLRDVSDYPSLGKSNK